MSVCLVNQHGPRVDGIGSAYGIFRSRETRHGLTRLRVRVRVRVRACGCEWLQQGWLHRSYFLISGSKVMCYLLYCNCTVTITVLWHCISFSSRVAFRARLLAVAAAFMCSLIVTR